MSCIFKCRRGERLVTIKIILPKHYLPKKAKICHLIKLYTSSDLANPLLGEFTMPAVAGGGSSSDLQLKLLC